MRTFYASDKKKREESKRKKKEMKRLKRMNKSASPENGAEPEFTENRTGTQGQEK